MWFFCTHYFIAESQQLDAEAASDTSTTTAAVTRYVMTIQDMARRGEANPDSVLVTNPYH
jgi:hypothetical protein